MYDYICFLPMYDAMDKSFSQNRILFLVPHPNSRCGLGRQRTKSTLISKTPFKASWMTIEGNLLHVEWVVVVGNHKNKPSNQIVECD